MMHNLHTVYTTIDNSPQSTLHLIIHCLIFGLVAGFCIVTYFGKGKKALITLNTGNKVNPFLIALLPISIVFFGFLSIDVLEINVYNYDKALYNSPGLKIVEGRITDYYPMSKDGHGDESFTVNGVEFHYSYWEKGRSGYHLPALYGGVIKPNLYVKIGYYYDGDRNAILKLETEY